MPLTILSDSNNSASVLPKNKALNVYKIQIHSQEKGKREDRKQ